MSIDRADLERIYGTVELGPEAVAFARFLRAEVDEMEAALDEDTYNLNGYEQASFTWEHYPPTPEEEAAERRRWNHPWARFKRWVRSARYRLGAWIAGVDW